MYLDWRAYAVGSAVFAALTAIFGKIAVSDLNSDLATFFRTLVVLALTGCIVYLRGEWQRPAELSARSILFLVLSGMATAGSWLCYYHALRLGPAARVAPIDKLSVVFVVLLAAAFLGERLTVKAAFGASLITAGAMLLAL